MFLYNGETWGQWELFKQIHGYFPPSVNSLDFAMKNVREICELKNSHSVGDVGKPWLGQLSNMLLVKSRVDGSF